MIKQFGQRHWHIMQARYPNHNAYRGLLILDLRAVCAFHGIRR